MNILKRSFCGALACAALAGMPQGAPAQTYPNKPVRVVVAFPPGTPNDFILRLISDRFQATLKQQLIIENRPGAGGNIGSEVVAKAAPDGYTLLGTVDTAISVNPLIYSKLSFRPETDLVPVIYLANSAQTLVCNPAVPANSVAELIAYAKTTPMNYASGGAGTPGHLAAELFLDATGVKMNHIPYKGPGPATQDVLGGQVPCGFLTTSVVAPHVTSGKLKGLAVTKARRSQLAPDLPTVAEAGVKGYEAVFGEMLLAPKGTPDSVVKLLNETISSILREPEIRERLLGLDLEFVANSPAEDAARIRRESDKWKHVVERIHLRVD
jgi:tripartite-type tricarboxylate transporter receptor subunit TctC